MVRFSLGSPEGIAWLYILGRVFSENGHDALLIQLPHCVASYEK